jgi:hypothetical protein
MEDTMTVNEAVALAGDGYRLEGTTDDVRVIGMRVLDRDGNVMAMFNCEGQEVELLPPLNAGTSNHQFVL